MAAGWEPLGRADERLRDALRTEGGGPADAVAVAVSWAGIGPLAALAGAALALGLLGPRAGWRPAVGWLLTLTAGAAVELAMKALLPSERPEERGIGSATIGLGGSFPSGHALYAALVAGLVWRLTTAPAARAAAAAWLLAVAWARVAVGVHWPSDAAGGALLGIALVSLVPLPGMLGPGGPRGPDPAPPARRPPRPAAARRSR